MYTRSTKIFFAFMVIVMGIGYPLSLIAGLPAFSGVLGGNVQAGNKQTEKLVNDARSKVRSLHCDRSNLPARDVASCKSALKDLGGGYQSLANPSASAANPNPPTPPLADRNVDKAVDAFVALYNLDPKDLDSLQLLAGAYALKGNYVLAEPLYAQLAQRSPDDPDAMLRWAETAQRANKTDVAIKAYQRFLKMAPDDPNAQSVKDQIKSLKTGGGGGASGATTAPTVRR